MFPLVVYFPALASLGCFTRSAAAECRAYFKFVNRPAVPERLRGSLVPSADGLPGRYKVRLPNGHTVYEVRIDEAGTVTQVDGRTVYANADLGFRMEDSLAIESY